MLDFMRDLPALLIGAASGLFAVRLLMARQRGAAQTVPNSVVAVWRAANYMTDDKRQLRVIRGGPNKIKDIKVIRSALPGFDIVGAKYILDHAPELVSAGLTPDAADTIKQQLEASGMLVQVELRSASQPATTGTAAA